jgi:hypothetical protein
MHLWPTYYTLEIRVYFLNLPQFTAELQILYSVHFPDFLLLDIICYICGMLYFHNIPQNIHNILLNIISHKKEPRETHRICN